MKLQLPTGWRTIAAHRFWYSGMVEARLLFIVCPATICFDQSVAFGLHGVHEKVAHSGAYSARVARAAKAEGGMSPTTSSVKAN